MKAFRRRLDREGRLLLPKLLQRSLSTDIRILGSNPITVLYPGSMDLIEAERHLSHLLVEVRRKIHEDSLGSYQTY